jgi:DNA uptake protein ComE-like DNA-binding protein
MKAFWSGIAVGAGLGVLFAPKPGRDSRKKVLQAINTMLNQHPTRDKSEPSERANHDDWVGDSHGATSQSSEKHPREEAVVETLNTAKKDELMSVQGIGNATAKRIIKNRPYKSVDEVIEKEVIPETTLDNVETKLVEKNEDAA